MEDFNFNAMMEGLPWDVGDDDGIAVGPFNDSTPQHRSATDYYLSRNYYTFDDTTPETSPRRGSGRRCSLQYIHEGHVTVTMENEETPVPGEKSPGSASYVNRAFDFNEPRSPKRTSPLPASPLANGPSIHRNSFPKEDVDREFPREFPKRRSIPIDMYHNPALKHQNSDGSMEAKSDLGVRRGSTSVLSASQLATFKKSRRMSTFATAHIQQRFTEQAKQAVSKFSSVNYSPTHSIHYMDWLKEFAKNQEIEWDRWFLTFWIGIFTGLLAVVLDQSLAALGSVKWSRAQEFMADGDLLKSWGWTVGISLVFIIISSVLVAFIHPPAAGGGTPEVLAYLNGVVVHGVFGLKNLVVKFTSNVFAVSSGLPCAIQGPIIAYGAIIGKGFGQFRSETLGCTPKYFTRFRNALDRRSFTTAGVAAGVAAAFNAPMGGLLFAMEDLSSFWSRKLSWQVFFSSVVATGVAGLFNSAFSGFKYQGSFGLFTLSLTEPIQIHVALLCVAIGLGLVGGLMGSIFTLVNTRVVAKARKLILSKMKQPIGFKIGRVSETLLLAILMTAYYILLPTAFECSNLANVNQNLTGVVSGCLEEGGIEFGNITINSPISVIPFNCEQPPPSPGLADYYYNEIATIVQNGGQAQLGILWSRGTHYFFRWYTPLVLLAVWFPMSIWTLGSCIAGGIFVPTLISGSLYGRSLGVGMVHLYKAISGTDVPTGDWAWIDPGLIAVVGAGSLLGGTTRLALASTVIVVEMSQDINMVIPVLVAVFVAKMVADLTSKPLYKCQLDAKTLPYLDQEPQVAVDGQLVNLELFKASDVMSSPVRTIRAVESLLSLSQLLTSTNHEGFPVIKRDFDTGLDVCYGLITRIELYAILYNDALYNEKTPGSVLNPEVAYDELSEDYISNLDAKYERVKTYGHFDVYRNIYVNLDPFINISATKVDGDFSLHRTYSLFRTLGLKHLVVIDIRNQPIGMITRQDLMAFNIQDKLSSLPSSDALDALMRQRDDSSSDTSSTSDGQSDTLLPAITLKHPVQVPTVSLKVDTIHEDPEEDEMASANSSRHSVTSQHSTRSRDSRRSVTSQASTRSRGSARSSSSRGGGSDSGGGGGEVAPLRGPGGAWEVGTGSPVDTTQL